MNLLYLDHVDSVVDMYLDCMDKSKLKNRFGNAKRNV
jgi:hypothetical protein